MISTLSLIAIFICAAFIVVCSIIHKVDIHPLTKGVLCALMLSIIGVLSKDAHPFGSQAMEAIIAFVAVLFIRHTYVSWDRGFV